MNSHEHKKLVAEYTDKISPEGHELPVRNDWDPITSKSSSLSNLHSGKHFVENELTQRFLLNLENNPPNKLTVNSQLYSNSPLMNIKSPGIIGQKAIFPNPIDPVSPIPSLKQEYPSPYPNNSLFSNLPQLSPSGLPNNMHLHGNNVNGNSHINVNQLTPGLLANEASHHSIASRMPNHFNFPLTNFDQHKMEPLSGRSLSCSDVDQQFLLDFDKLNLNHVGHGLLLDKNARGRAPPDGYLCHLCFQKGHYIKDCVLVSFVSPLR